VISLGPLLLGCFLGVISGLLPGVGNFLLLLIATPFLLGFDPISLIICYVALVSISQYIGSVPAVLYGVPGEASSFPAVVESKRLHDADQVSEAISGAAFGSFIGGLTVALCCYFLLEYIELIKYFFSTKLFVAIIVFALIIVCFVSGKNLILNFCLVGFGLLLGLIGFNSFINKSFLTFDSPHLYGGLPFLLVSIFLYALPQLYQNFDSKRNNFINDTAGLKVYIPNILTSALNSILGFVGGLFPGLTTILSSYLAYFVSKFFTNDPVKHIVSSETANNSGAFSQLLPLLLFGIPLLSSEAYLLTLLEIKGFDVLDVSFSSLFMTISYSFILINFIGLMLAWPLAKQVSLIYSFDFKIIFVFLGYLLVFISFYIGYLNNSIYFYILTMLGLLPLTLLLRNINTMPLIFAFLLHDTLFESVVRLTKLI
jgi:putative tricarboxylic transport membrane protein